MTYKITDRLDNKVSDYIERGLAKIEKEYKTADLSNGIDNANSLANRGCITTWKEWLETVSMTMDGEENE